MKKVTLVLTVTLAIAISLAVVYRHHILIPLATTGERIPPNQEYPTLEGGQVFGEDAYFVVIQIDQQTFAIAEPKSWAYNFNYLILGEQRALLFDAGVGHYDIRPVVRALTDLPLTFMPSHFHYDHTGQGDWAHVAIADIPHIRAQAQATEKGDRLTLTWAQHLGSTEGLSLPTWTVSEWVRPGTSIDLGNRSLTLIYTPGHTDNSVSLLDVESNILFSGDFMQASGQWHTITPTGNMGDYLQSAKKVLDLTSVMPDIIFRGAHSNSNGTIPAQPRADMMLLHNTLEDIRSGETPPQNFYPVIYQVSKQQVFAAEPPLLQNWTPTYPDGHPVHSDQQ